MRIGFASSSWTGLWILLFPPASSTSASPTRTSFGLPWTSPRRQPGRWSISKTPRCSSRSRKVWGFEAFSTRITGPRARNWLRSDCAMTEEVSRNSRNPRHSKGRRIPIMDPHADQPTAPESKLGSKPDTKPDAKDDLKTLPLAEVEKKLGSSPDGLTQAEAQKRLTQYGPNELTEKKTNLLLKFLSYFWGPIPWMIEVAVILSGVVRHWPDFFIILLLLVANAVVGFWEEREAGNA